jgi:broad specificity phosphatase PhoE
MQGVRIALAATALILAALVPQTRVGSSVTAVLKQSGLFASSAASHKPSTSRPTMGPTFFLARHGERLDFVDPKWLETAANPHDAPLTVRGEQQARELGHRLSGENIARVVSSPFTRTVLTAVGAAFELSRTRPQVGIEPGAVEWLNAEWYGTHPPRWSSVEHLSSQHASIDMTYKPVFDMACNAELFPETYDDVLQRAQKTIKGLLELHGDSDGNILVVGHGSSVEAFYKALVPDSGSIKVTYCSLTVCVPQGDGSYRADIVTDTAHLTHPENPEKTRYA